VRKLQFNDGSAAELEAISMIGFRRVEWFRRWWVAIGRRDVFMPMGKLFRSKKIVKCPETGEAAEILVDTSPGSPLKPMKKRFSIRNCSLWLKRKGCTRTCEK